MPTTTTTPRPLRERAADIVRFLGQGWSVAEPDPDRTWQDRIELDGPDGMGLYLELSGGRIYISGTYPRDQKHGSYAPREAPRISVAESKSVGQIARDINSRFLPDYRASYEAARERQRANDDMHAAEHRLMERLAPIVRATAPSHEPTRASCSPGGNIYLEIDTRGGSSINLRLDRVPEEIAAQILAVIAEAAG